VVSFIVGDKDDEDISAIPFVLGCAPRLTPKRPNYRSWSISIPKSAEQTVIVETVTADRR
jgi:hypothetical protein